MDEINKLIADGEYKMASEACKRHLHYRGITLAEYTAKIAEIDSLQPSTPAKAAAPAKGCYNPRNWVRNVQGGRELGNDF